MPQILVWLLWQLQRRDNFTYLRKILAGFVLVFVSWLFFWCKPKTLKNVDEKASAVFQMFFESSPSTPTLILCTDLI